MNYIKLGERMSANFLAGYAYFFVHSAILHAVKGLRHFQSL